MLNTMYQVYKLVLTNKTKKVDYLKLFKNL